MPAESVKANLLTSTLGVAVGVALFVGVPVRVAEAQYSPNIQGGGSTLAGPIYRQDFNCFGMPLTNPPDPDADTFVPAECTGGSYPIDTTKIFRYAGVGSGRGQCMYLAHDPSYNNDAPRPISAVDFAGSDAALTANQIDKFTNGGTLGSESSACAGVVIPAQAPVFGPLIMVPSLATPITLAISPNTASTLNILPVTPPGGTSGLTFSRAGYCKVLTGQITDWSSTDGDFISQNIDPVLVGNAQPPSPAATTAGMGDVPPPAGTDRLNPLNWVPLVADPQNVNAYPIVGYTTQEFYSCYSTTSGVDVKANGIEGLLTWALSSPDGVPDQVLNDNGFAPLPSDWKAAILDAFVNGGDGNNLQIRVGPVSGFCTVSE
jgi:hypothetical protein